MGVSSIKIEQDVASAASMAFCGVKVTGWADPIMWIRDLENMIDEKDTEIGTKDTTIATSTAAITEKDKKIKAYEDEPEVVVPKCFFKLFGFGFICKMEPKAD